MEALRCDMCDGPIEEERQDEIRCRVCGTSRGEGIHPVGAVRLSDGTRALAEWLDPDDYKEDDGGKVIRFCIVGEGRGEFYYPAVLLVSDGPVLDSYTGDCPPDWTIEDVAKKYEVDRSEVEDLRAEVARLQAEPEFAKLIERAREYFIVQEVMGA